MPSPSRYPRRRGCRGRTVAVLAAALAVLPIGGQAVPAAEPISPIPPVEADAGGAEVRLGEMLFRDVRLSRGDAVACVSCHRLDGGGDDGLARTPGRDGRLLDFNTPTVFNVAGNFRFNWRGNFRELEAQAEAALLDPRLMGARWAEMMATLRGDAAYRRAFEAAYGGEPSRRTVLAALAAFQRSLVTPHAPFDRYLNGERDAITDEQKHGYRLFKSYGCAACHQGVNVGGNLFQRFGIFDDPFAEGPIDEADLGRFTITGEESDRHVFRVPSLRNVGVTAPYFHDGRAATLDQAVEEMAASQLGRQLTDRETDLIVGFLRSLTGEYRGRRLRDQPETEP